MSEVVSFDSRKLDRAKSLLMEISKATERYMNGEIHELSWTIKAIEQKHGMLADEAGRLVLSTPPKQT